MPRIPLIHPETGETVLATAEGAPQFIDAGYVAPEPEPEPEPETKPKSKPKAGGK